MRNVIAFIWLVLSISCSGVKPKIVGHRGCRFEGPYENTLASMRFAQKAGVDAIEFDVQLTSDDSVIVFHGPIVPGLEEDIRTIPFARARSVVLPGGHQMPTLEEWFAQAANCPRISLIMEIKKQLSDEKTILLAQKVLEKAGTKVEYTSFSTIALDEIHRLETSAKLIILQSGTPANPASWAAEKGYQGISYNLDGFMNNPQIIEEARSLGIETTLWLVNDKEVLDWAVRHRIDYVSSDHPERLVEWLGRR